MKGIVLSSENNKTVVLTDEGNVVRIRGSYEVGQRINIRNANRPSGMLKNVSIVLGTIAVLMIFTIFGLYAVGKNSDSDDSAVSSSSSEASSEDASSDTSTEETSEDASSESSDDTSTDDEADTSDSSSEETSSDMPQPGTDGEVPADVPSDNGQQGPGGQAPDGQMPDGQAPDGQMQGAPSEST